MLPIIRTSFWEPFSVETMKLQSAILILLVGILGFRNVNAVTVNVDTSPCAAKPKVTMDVPPHTIGLVVKANTAVALVGAGCAGNAFSSLELQTLDGTFVPAFNEMDGYMDSDDEDVDLRAIFG